MPSHCRIGKVRLHNWNMEHCKEPHPYPQRIMIHQKGHETLKNSNRNQNPEEAQVLKKEGPPLCQKRRENNEKKKNKERKKEQKKKKKERNRKIRNRKNKIKKFKTT